MGGNQIQELGQQCSQAHEPGRLLGQANVRHTDDKDTEVDPSTVNNSVIEPGDTLQINACGRHSSPSGTTGDLDLVDTTAGDKKIRHFYWDCPWASSKNTWTVSGSNEGWMVESDGANLEDGALGTITVEFLNKA